MDTLEAVRSFRKRIIVSTDLVARGIDLGAAATAASDLCPLRLRFPLTPISG